MRFYVQHSFSDLRPIPLFPMNYGEIFLFSLIRKGFLLEFHSVVVFACIAIFTVCFATKNIYFRYAYA